MKDMGYLAGPTDGDLYMAAIAPDQSRVNEFQADRDTFFTNAIRHWPELADLMAAAKRVGPLRVFTKWHGYFRQSAGPGGSSSATPDTSKTSHPARAFPTRCAKHDNWRAASA